MENRRSKKYNNFKEAKRTILLAKKDDHVAEVEKPIILQHSSSDAPKILIKTKEKSTKQTVPAPISIATRETSDSGNAVVSGSIPVVATAIISRDHKDLQAPTVVEQPHINVPQMDKPINILNESYQLNKQAFDYLLDSNSHFFVVGVIGTQGSGKSTLLNVLCPIKEQNVDVEDYFFRQRCGIFPTKSTKEQLFTSAATTEGIQMFITKERTILLDCSPVLCNPYKRDFVLSEIDDLRMVILMLSVCHLLIVVVEDEFMSLNLLRLLQCAEKMKPNFYKDLPNHAQDEYFSNILFVKNMANARDFLPEHQQRVNTFYKHFFKQSKLSIYPGGSLRQIIDTVNDDENDGENLKKLSISMPEIINFFTFPHIRVNRDKFHYLGHPNVDLIIDDFRQRVFMSPRHQMQIIPLTQSSSGGGSVGGVFLERNWSHLVSNVWESHKNSYFLRKYENFKEKEWISQRANI